jgi:5'-deoxynucleotidase YfbR-like HD superfamily hydrolase
VAVANSQPEEKHLRERLAIMFLSCLAYATNPIFARSIMDLWLEFENGTIKEAILVHDFNRLKYLLQAIEYKKSQDIKSLQEFLPEADGIETYKVKI